MNRLFCVISFINISIVICFSQNSKIREDFQNKKEFSHASVGVCVQDMNGKDIISINKDVSLTPASILKIVTTASALEILGESYKFKTELALDKNQKNRLLIIGYGDPTLGSEYMDDATRSFLNIWKEKIKNKGFSSPVDIIVYDDYFGYQGVSRKWIKEDMGNYYAAGTYGISIFDNSYKLFFNTMSGNSPQLVTMEPEIKSLEFVNILKLNTTGKDNGYIWGEPFSNKRILTGDIPAKRKSFSIKGDIPDPGLYLGELVADKLAPDINVKSIATAREAYYGNMFSPSGSKEALYEIFYTQYSSELKDIIRVVNVRSNNHYAEHIIRMIGRYTNNDKYSEPLGEGIKAINDYWASKNMDSKALFMYDGCGLSPSNAVSPAFMCGVLRYMYKQSWYSKSFFASFPEAGREGTVRNFLKGTRLEGKIFVKSGSIANVRCYSGYYIDGVKEYVFTVMVNKFSDTTSVQVMKSIETLLLEVLK